MKLTPWRDAVHVLPADPDRAGAGPVQPGDLAERRRLAAAGRADDRAELAGLDGEGDVADRGERLALRRQNRLVRSRDLDPRRVGQPASVAVRSRPGLSAMSLLPSSVTTPRCGARHWWERTVGVRRRVASPFRAHTALSRVSTGFCAFCARPQLLVRAATDGRQSARVRHRSMRKLSSQIFVGSAGHPDRDDARRVRAVRRAANGHSSTGSTRPVPPRSPQTVAGCPRHPELHVRHPAPRCAGIDPARRQPHPARDRRVLRRRHRHEPGPALAPDPALIGQTGRPSRSSRPTGGSHVGIDNGSHRPLGERQGAAATRRPARMIGEVSVGIRESSVSSALWRELPDLRRRGSRSRSPLGAVASWLLARRLKRRTFGLELDEIARLLQEREATLHGIREGVIAFDPRGPRVRRQRRGAAAARRAAVPDRRHGWRTCSRPGRLRDVLAGAVGGPGRGRPHRRLLPGGQPDAGHAGRPTARRRRHPARPHRDGRAAARARRRARPDRRRCAPSSTSSPTACTPSPACSSSASSDEALSYLRRAEPGAAEFDNTLRARIGSPLDRRAAARQGGRGERARSRLRRSPPTPGSAKSPPRCRRSRPSSAT